MSKWRASTAIVASAPLQQKPKKVLEEDTYVDALAETIIERDFFPQLPKLKAQKDYLDALGRNDTNAKREKAVIEQTKMTTSTAQTHSSISANAKPRPYLHGQHPCSRRRLFTSPYPVSNQSSAPCPGARRAAKTPPTCTPVPGQPSPSPVSETLDQFLQSENNASFKAIIEATNERLSMPTLSSCLASSRPRPTGFQAIEALRLGVESV